MSVSFITSLTHDELKELIRETVRETLLEVLPQAHKQKESFPDVLNVKEAAKYLKLQIATIYEKTSRRIIPHFKKGNKVYFHRPELESWIRSGRVKSQDEIKSEAASYSLNRI
jgi:excisionase family DNA binding protein